MHEYIVVDLITRVFGRHAAGFFEVMPTALHGYAANTRSAMIKRCFHLLANTTLLLTEQRKRTILKVYAEYVVIPAYYAGLKMVVWISISAVQNRYREHGK